MLQDYEYRLSPALNTFPRFRKLPPELRVKIWHHALPGPRTIHLVSTSVRHAKPADSPESLAEDDMLSPFTKLNAASRMINQRRRRPHTTTCSSTVPCPIEITSLLHACRESRFEALSRYQPLHNPKSPDNPYYRIHYFDPSIDGIFVEDMWPWVSQSCIKPTGIFKSKRLSISCNTWLLKFFARNGTSLFSARHSLLKFKDLEELHIVFRIPTEQELAKVCRHNASLRGEHTWSNIYSAHHMAPHVMTEFLRKPDAPYDIAFPEYGCMERIHVDEIMKKFEEVHKNHPDWKIPKVKLIQWATRPVVESNSEWEDWSD